MSSSTEISDTVTSFDVATNLHGDFAETGRQGWRGRVGNRVERGLRLESIPAENPRGRRFKLGTRVNSEPAPAKSVRQREAEI